MIAQVSELARIDRPDKDNDRFAHGRHSFRFVLQAGQTYDYILSDATWRGCRPGRDLRGDFDGGGPQATTVDCETAADPQPGMGARRKIMDQPKTKPRQVLVADDHAMVLEMFGQFLSNLSDMEPRTAPELDTALALMDEHGPFDLALIDLNMPGMNGVSGLGRAIERNGGKPVGLLTSNPSANVVHEALALGAAGIVLKTESLSNLTNVIRFMLNGGRYVPVELIVPQRTAMREQSVVGLSEREFTVLALLAEGKSNRDIGEALGLAEPTVKMHVKSICSKLGAKNRTQAVIAARDGNLI